MADLDQIELPNGSTYTLKDSSVPHSSLAAASGGTTLSLVTTGEKYIWAQGGTDTKNTAGATDTSSKIFLVGALEQTANPQTYSDDQVYVTNGTLTAGNAQATILGVVPTNGTSGGVSLYGGTGAVDNYGVAFRTTTNKGKHGDVQGDWATYFTMNDADNRGWIFRRNGGAGNVASVSTKGNAVFNGAVTVGGNTTNTTGCSMQFNSTTQSLDFVFK